MLALGIDPGMATIGYGLVRELDDGSLQPVAYNVITTPAGMPLWERLQLIHEGVVRVLEQYHPDRVGIEELFFAKNVTTALSVAHARGVIMLALAQANIPIAEYKPNMIKQSVAGYGGAKKPQMQEMTRILLGLEEIPRPDDAADALAIAITDIHNSRYAGWE
ncbi:MAG TPA: crossover junction endodeoxyribonuclease RuvC [Phototrophicaceae bacterium]|jgi:crossover junction endodeoxyribonuclease RuvC|nr:crossover junction endodeoxyribonuclease RuvC [Phototrophicaceae bacterium]